MSTTLDNFIKHSKAPPKALATSQEIRDRSSIFVGALYRAASPAEAKDAINHHRHVVHGEKSATHEMSAWHVMALKRDRDGLGGEDDFEVQSHSDDDGEAGGGKRVLQTMQKEGVLDAVVIVSRWYGGRMLGPVRFTHIEICAREVCRTFKAMEEVEEHISQLKDLDKELLDLRAELASISPPVDSQEVASGSPVKGPKLANYEEQLLTPPDVAKAIRLVNARRNAIKNVKGLIEKRKTHI